VAGQMVAAIVVEHFGLLGSAKVQVSLSRVGGVVLVVLGVVAGGWRVWRRRRPRAEPMT